ncbi:CAP domain-containing protein [Desulfotruncus alcoholivorax]|uniref:CAP domain-containing protein n=1 Tax=Desulfotruncus alcoholivorax TaxID=265477 RepID=UPI0003F80915|nr:CAP domain-containing protein [Desulfotruncus alcoholivorax]
MLELVNQERSKAGLPMYEVDPKLVQLARMKSKDMYHNRYFRHTSPTYGSALSMEIKAGFSAMVMGAENIAKAATVLRTHELIMNSANHRNNVLDPRHTIIGIGIFETPYGVYVTQLFAGN